jgi:signal peptidase II
LKNIKNSLIKKEIIICLTLIIIIYYFDRFTKNIIINNYNKNQIFINDYLNFDLIWNTGIGFGFFSTTSTTLYYLITILIGIVILGLLYLILISDNIDKIIYSIIIGGALGNFHDRLLFQAVPDFIDIHYNSFHWFTFNVADIFITIGIIAFALRGFFVKN